MTFERGLILVAIGLCASSLLLIDAAIPTPWVRGYAAAFPLSLLALMVRRHAL